MSGLLKGRLWIELRRRIGRALSRGGNQRKQEHKQCDDLTSHTHHLYEDPPFSAGKTIGRKRIPFMVEGLGRSLCQVTLDFEILGHKPFKEK
jgi:hypothetical protein